MEHELEKSIHLWSWNELPKPDTTLAACTLECTLRLSRARATCCLRWLKKFPNQNRSNIFPTKSCQVCFCCPCAPINFSCEHLCVGCLYFVGNSKLSWAEQPQRRHQLEVVDDEGVWTGATGGHNPLSRTLEQQRTLCGNNQAVARLTAQQPSLVAGFDWRSKFKT